MYFYPSYVDRFKKFIKPRRENTLFQNSAKKIAALNGLEEQLYIYHDFRSTTATTLHETLKKCPNSGGRR
eukprot:snap_masked-scaffold_25-processed-gene-1.28-mRNA-1 protein AED:1.00 eAED:1.00 QI:0/-1/0/0/-1/1/1/0/69